MSDSSLVNKQWWANSTNYAKGRTSNIKGIVIHHAASTSLNSIGQVFSQAGRKGSAHYGVGGSEIHQYVHECDTAWHCSNRNGNNATIGIETTNSTREPNWEVSDLTLSTLIKLVADVAKRNNLGWLSVNPSADYPTISGHKDWKGASTVCLPVDATELLTTKGFVPLGEINSSDKIAQWDSETGEITFTEPLNIVEPYLDKVSRIRKTEATDKHQAFDISTGELKKVEWGSKNRFKFPTNAKYSAKGLELTNDEVEFLVWVQADGHYMKDGDCLYGIEFHFSKQRKIDRVVALLEEMGKDYVITKQDDGTTKIRLYGKSEVEWCERFLHNKQFTMDWIELSNEQYDRFREVLILADGCEANSSYSSAIKRNLDVVQIILQLHGQTSHIYNDNRLFFGAHTYYLDARNGRTERETIVSCVEMPKGSIIIRQYGKIQIIGNCPGPYLYPRLQYIADEANKINFPPKPVEVTWVPMDTPRTLITNAGATLVSLPSLGVVKNYEEGVALECDQKCIFNGKTYIRTKYSTSKGISNGFDFDQLHEVPAPEPPKPEWADIAIKKIQAIRETNLIDIVSGEVQKTYPEATIVEVTQECVFNDNKFYRTEYSKNRDVNYGFIASDFQDYVEPIPEPIPEPEPTPEPTPEPEPEPSDEKEREETVNILQKIIDFINRIIKLITTKKEN